MDPSDITGLETRFGIPGEVAFARGPNGLPVVAVSNALGTARIALSGAQLLSWAPHSGERVVWLSPRARFAPGQAVRGGVPVCWPWFGPHPRESAWPAHGFARTAPWEVIEAAALEDGSSRLGFRLMPNPARQAQWPFATPLEIRHTVGAALEIELRTRNESAAPVVIGEALHTYFDVSDVRGIRIEGLDGCEYLDKTDKEKRQSQQGPVVFAGETDRVYLNTAADCLIEDPGLNRRIRIEKRGSASTVIWNPGQEKAARLGDLGEDGYLRMVCVESANVLDNVITLAPGEEHRLWVRYTVERLG
jgi:glucose-6-phosphate 1-epimerase